MIDTRYPPVPQWLDQLNPDESYRRLAAAVNYLLERTQTGWDDLRFPAQGINPIGSASPPGVETSTGLLLFSGTGTEVIAGIAQMPHAWEEGTPIMPHVHWSKTTSVTGDVLWQLDYEVVQNGDVAAMTYPNQLQVSTPVDGTPDNDTSGEALISSFGEISMLGYTASCMILWKVSRIGGTDSYNSDARLFEVDFHYRINDFGSDTEFRKNG